jgi:hypothetical protein
MSTRNPCLTVALEELAKAGIRRPEIASGKHLQVRWTMPNGQQRMCIVSHTAAGGDRHAIENARRAVRQILRADNMLETPGPRTPPARQPSRIELLERRLAEVERRLGIGNQEIA